MSDFKLISTPPLAGYDRSFDGATLKAPADMALVSIALPLGGEDAAKKAVEDAYGTALPEIGKSAVTGDNAARLIRMGQDQAFVLFTRATPDAEPFVADKLKGAAYTTDQTDVWCALELKGARSRDVLERICPLDLHPDAFAVNDAARTVMEHLGALIIRTDTDTFLLLSASSSAKSFLHAVETSIANVV